VLKLSSSSYEKSEELVLPVACEKDAEFRCITPPYFDFTIASAMLLIAASGLFALATVDSSESESVAVNATLSRTAISCGKPLATSLATSIRLN
jgi:hypothetical protein